MKTIIIVSLLAGVCATSLQDMVRAEEASVLKEEHTQEAALLKEVEQLTAARDRAMDAQENGIPNESDYEEIQKRLSEATKALEAHQKNLKDMFAKAAPAKAKHEQKAKKTKMPVSLLEEISGQSLEAMHQAEVKELFVKVNKQGLPHESVSQEDVLATFLETGVSRHICEAATKHMMDRMDTDKDGRISFGEGMDFVRMDSKSKFQPSALIQKESAEMTSAAEQMKVNATVALTKIMAEQEAKEEVKKQLREKRWKNMLERQRASLVEREKALKKQQKELDRLEREDRWQQAEAKKQSSFLEKKGCGEQHVHTFLTTPHAPHAQCLKLQLGECADVNEVQTPVFAACDGNSKGWQKQCLNLRAQEAHKCAPAGVNWEALRMHPAAWMKDGDMKLAYDKKGDSTTFTIDDKAVAQLEMWCAVHNALEEIKKKKYPKLSLFEKPDYVLILGQGAAIPKDFTSKFSNFVSENDQFNMLQIDNSQHSLAVSADAAEAILDVMDKTPAEPISDLIARLGEQGIVTKTWNKGVTGAMDLHLMQNSEIANNGYYCSPHRL